MNDLGSGSNVDLCIITKDGVEYLRNYEYLQAKTYTRQFPVKYPPGTASKSGRGRLCKGQCRRQYQHGCCSTHRGRGKPATEVGVSLWAHLVVDLIVVDLSFE